MNSNFAFTSLSDLLKKQEIKDAAEFKPPTSEERKKQELTEQVIQIIKDFDEMKMKFNDCLSFEAQALKEQDEDTKENLENIFRNRTKKLFAFHYILEEKMKKRLSGNIA